MRRDTGEIISEREAAEVNAKFPGMCIPMEIAPTPKQKFKHKVGRNDPCPCGSGKKFKQCCLITFPTLPAAS